MWLTYVVVAPPVKDALGAVPAAKCAAVGAGVDGAVGLERLEYSSSILYLDITFDTLYHG